MFNAHQNPLIYILFIINCFIIGHIIGKIASFIHYKNNLTDRDMSRIYRNAFMNSKEMHFILDRLAFYVVTNLDELKEKEYKVNLLFGLEDSDDRKMFLPLVAVDFELDHDIESDKLGLTMVKSFDLYVGDVATKEIRHAFTYDPKADITFEENSILYQNRNVVNDLQFSKNVIYAAMGFESKNKKARKKVARRLSGKVSYRYLIDKEGRSGSEFMKDIMGIMKEVEDEENK